MRKIEIDYDPYKMETVVTCDGKNVCENSRMPNGFKKFIESRTPLQTWIEPIPYRDWPGIVSAIVGDDNNDELEIVFSGRKIDFNDLKRSCEAQNKKREVRNRIKFHYIHKTVRDDLVLSKNIDEVVKELQSERFKELLKSRGNESAVRKKYDNLDENYKKAKNDEFLIVFSGIYSSGKSTLLNALIRHRVLPTSDSTCTSKNCRIRHDATIGTGVSLECFDENGQNVGQKEFFDNDEACLAKFMEISPIKSEKIIEEFKGVKTIELSVNLSHLYPDSVNEDDFKLVLIDSPGIDSAYSITDGVNVHASVALEAITMDSMPMIVFCASALKEYDTNIGEFMGRIAQQSIDDNGGFNDRFLFVLNRCDDKQYQGSESIRSFKEDYADYLNDDKKWGVLSDKTKEASNFVPRIFLTSAYVAMAIKNGAYAYDKATKIADSDKRSLSMKYEAFAGNIFDYGDENYFLSTNSDIPEHSKNDLKKAFDSAIKNGDKVRATEIQCGVEAVEIAIRDYIARYAYPIKVRSLLSTFDSILSDVSEMEKVRKEALEKQFKELGEKENTRKGVEKEKKQIENQNNAYSEAKKNADKHLETLKSICFDPTELGRARTLFEENIEANETIKHIRGLTRAKYIVKTGNKSRDMVEKEISQKLQAIEKVFNDAIEQAKEKFSETATKHDNQLEKICSQLKKIVNDLKSSGALQFNGYNFEKSTIWTDQFQFLNVAVLRKEVQKNITDHNVSYDEVYNPRRLELECGNWFRRKIQAKFHRKHIIERHETDGEYSLEPIITELDESYIELNKQTANMKKAYERELSLVKENVENMVNELFGEIKKYETTIEKQSKAIRDLGSSIKKLEQKRAACEDTYKWLAALKTKIEGVV